MTPPQVPPRHRLHPLRLCATVAMLVAAAAPVRAQPAPPVTPPEVLSHVDAVYPASLVAQRKHADVTLTVTVDLDGHVSDVVVTESGGRELDEAAIVAARQWVFTPAMRGEQPVRSRIKIPFHFAPPAPPPEIVATPARPGPPESPVAGGVVPAPGGSPATGPAAGELRAANRPAPAPEAVHVRGHSRPLDRGASDFQMRIDALGAVPRQNATELLKLAPGVLLTNEGGEGHAQQVFLRGFDAREGQDIAFSVDGVSANDVGNLHGNGYADLHFIIPELVESLRVIEGPFDPRQGNFAVAGSADYQLGLERRGLTAKVTRGSFGTERALLTWGPPKANAHTFGGVELHHTDGYGQNREATRASAMAQVEGPIGEHGFYRVQATAYSTHYKSPGPLREDDYESGRVGFYDTYDRQQGGDSSRYSVSGDIELRSGEMVHKHQIFVIARSMRLRENFTGFLLDVQDPLKSPHGQRGDLLDLSVDAVTIGAQGFGRWRAKALGQTHDFEIGYFARGDQTTGSQYRIDAAKNVPYKLETDLDARLGNIGLYADANLRATRWLAVRGGVRADLFTYDVLDKCAVKDIRNPSSQNPPGDASCLSQQDNGVFREPVQRSSTASTALLPRATLVVGPVREFTFSASVGKGVRSIDPVYINQDLSTPFASITAYEAGVSYSRSWDRMRLTARSIFFQTNVDRDLIFNETVGRNTLADGTTRTGWVGAVRATGPFFDESANLTLVRSTFDDDGRLIPYVPDVVLRSDTALFRELPWRIDGETLRGALGAGVTFVGRRPLPFGQRSDTVFTLDGAAMVAWKGVEVGLVATNLLDRQYRLGEFNYASDFRSQPQPTLVPARHFIAGAPRAVFLSLAVTVGGT